MILHGDGLQWFDDLVFHAASGKLSIVDDRRALELARDPPIGEIKAQRHFGESFMHPVAEAQPSTDPAYRIKAVDVDTLAEISNAKSHKAEQHVAEY